MKTAYIAALPRELAPFLRGSAWSATPQQAGVRLYTSADAVAVCAGIGSAAATRAFSAALLVPGIRRVVSVGLAGACQASLRVADVLHCSVVIDLRSGERFACASQAATQSVLVTSHLLATAREKRRLHASYSAALVDMEAATIARLASAHGLAFDAIKAVSDAAETTLPDLKPYITATGQLRELRVAVHIATHPTLWPSAIRLARDSQRAITAMTRALQTDRANHA